MLETARVSAVVMTNDPFDDAEARLWEEGTERDARVLDQLIYKWAHSRRIIADALYEAYESLLRDGRAVTREEIERDTARLFFGNFSRWVGPGTREA